MEKSKFVKDIPLGVLLLVLAQFMFYGVIYLAKYPSYLELAGIVFCTLMTSDMITFGIKLIKGYNDDSGEH